jgi:hypothetical protein
MTRLETLLDEHRLDLQEHLLLLASLLSLSPPADRYPPLQMSPQQQRQRTLDMLLALTLARAKQQPVLSLSRICTERSVHSLEWLGLLIDQGPNGSYPHPDVSADVSGTVERTRPCDLLDDQPPLAAAGGADGTDNRWG